MAEPSLESEQESAGGDSAASGHPWQFPSERDAPDSFFWICWTLGPAFLVAFVAANSIIAGYNVGGTGAIASGSALPLLVLAAFAHVMGGLVTALHTLSPGSHWRNPLHWILLVYWLSLIATPAIIIATGPPATWLTVVTPLPLGPVTLLCGSFWPLVAFYRVIERRRRNHALRDRDQDS